MPSERVSDGILFDRDVSAAVCLYVVIWRYFCPVLSDFTAVTVTKGGTGGFIVNKAAVVGGLGQYRYP
ncbi:MULTISPECIES: hypothetical protein [Neisseria]|uniref:hypothetical protein n=1 Tax=Neisseria TaxID=482 RepID=UPI00166109CE|nr:MULTISPECIES: hypothetical protein [Neisseria]